MSRAGVELVLLLSVFGLAAITAEDLLRVECHLRHHLPHRCPPTSYPHQWSVSRPNINATSNNNVIVNVFNFLNEPFLISWKEVQRRKNSWQDGVAGSFPLGDSMRSASGRKKKKIGSMQ
ncbi:L-ascorbate oxidase [Canna indica]|uniref:L-ascorbate oxidase n=1 Tax=Canna indica TaxID=4628 RepID=A0AAQ3JYY8_9LILI|nr:L-ascorbate oxidase [Canna indica]